MLSDENRCQYFDTKSKAHRAGTHGHIIALQSSWRHDGESYCNTEMWFPLDEAEEIVRVLQESIIVTKAYLASQKQPEDGAVRAE